MDESKYDFTIDHIDPLTAHGKVLMRVPKHSMVLECGCATGYMTKYMAHELHCKVHVIEKDLNAIERAEIYADDAFGGDLQKLRWYHYYRKNKYDVILFADVLEHLTNPLEVLKSAVELLKPDGKVIISIPNICHNDVVLNMIFGRFTYTRFGLLDDGHVRFWGHADFLKFLEEAGLAVADRATVYIQTGCTEQNPCMDTVPAEVLDFLRRRPDGDAYQYVYDCRRIAQWTTSSTT